MILVYPFSTVDQELAVKNAIWIKELGGCKGHDVLMIADARCNNDVIGEIQRTLNESFDSVHVLIGKAAIDGWPEGANYFFRIATAWLQVRASQWPFFFWMEPDAIPMEPGWFDTIVLEFNDEVMRDPKKKFMGDRVQVENVPLHMSGIGVYPNPLHQYAGDAYRAAEEAWDMAGRHQIVPQAHFTDLIEHAWRHPKFESMNDLDTQISKHTVLFHSSKDGSLIDLLRSKRGGKQSSAPSIVAGPTQKEPEEPGSPSPIISHEQKEAVLPMSTLTPDSVSPNCDIFIRTYPGDYEWLQYCLQSIKKYCRVFRKLWIVSPAKIHLGTDWGIETEWKQINEESEDGYLSQQITKLYADVITDYQPDYILHVDSDTLFTREARPEDFFQDGKLIWYYTPYSAIETPWQPITEKFIQKPVHYEFMRRLPIMIPRWLYPRLREFCYQTHGRIITDYIRNQPERAFSEFNALGAYAWYYYQNSEISFRTTGGPMPPPFARQFHSWGGITPEVKMEIEEILSEKRNKTAEAITALLSEEPPYTKEQLLGGAGPGPVTAAKGHHIPYSTVSESIAVRSDTNGVTPSSRPFIILGHEGNKIYDSRIPEIKELPDGTWVIEGDQISQWVEQEGRLDHDQNLLPEILKHIKEGDTVLDIGAHIGDHTVAYVRAAGVHGAVHAFEPHPQSYACLTHNISEAFFYNVALSDNEGTVSLSGNNGQPSGSYIGKEQVIANIRMRTLDSFKLKPDFIKIDAEGYEPKILKGAEWTITHSWPIMVIEVNRSALERQGFDPSDIYTWLTDHGYSNEIIQSNCSFASPMYDLICTPRGGGPEQLKNLLSKPTQVRQCVEWLKDFAAQSQGNKIIVGQQLAKAGLKKPNPKKKK